MRDSKRKLLLLCLVLLQSAIMFGQTGNIQNFEDDEANAAMLLPDCSDRIVHSDTVWP